jgi:DNA polymerase elongation subunit (family B)
MIGKDFFVRGIENGRRVEYKKEYQPKLYIKSNTKTEFKTLEGEYLKEIQPGNARECKKFISKYEDVDNFKVYGNERFLYQFISDEFSNDIEYNLKDIIIYFIDIEVSCENGFPSVDECTEEILLITIQDYSSKKITTWGTKPYTCTLEKELKKKYVESELNYIQCDDEKHLLLSFTSFWKNRYPDIVSGWNCHLYDIPYICGRLDMVLGDKNCLSPWNYVYSSEEWVNNRNNIVYKIPGVSILDYMILYKKYILDPRESYSLNYIAEVELKQTKLDHSEFNTFKDFYTNGWNKYVDYNIVDTVLVGKLEEKLRLIELVINLAYDAKVNYNDVLFQVRTWDMIIYNYLKQFNIIIPPKQKVDKEDKYPGGYVKEPIPGVYDYIVNFDLNSLYPHLIMQYNISPETLVEKETIVKNISKLNDKLHSDDISDDKKSLFREQISDLRGVLEIVDKVTIEKLAHKNIDLSSLNKCGLTVAPNGSLYKKDRMGFLPTLMETMYNERVKFKNKMIEAKRLYQKTKDPKLLNEISRCNIIQMARKVALNSAYGAIGNQWFRYYKLENASAITTSGQVSIKWIEIRLNSYFNRILKTDNVDYCVAIDTDSIYLNMADFVKKIFKNGQETGKIIGFLDKVCEEKIIPYIDKCYAELATYMNAYQQKMEMKREFITSRGIWLGKKRYILNVWDSEGVRYSEPQLKMKGIEAIKSSTPTLCRDLFKRSFHIIMNKTEEDLIKFLIEARSEFEKSSVEMISFPRSVSNISKWQDHANLYIKKTPVQVRGAILHNHHLKVSGYSNKYQYIKNGDKVKFCYLKLPNPINENVISFFEFPKELNLAKYIDYDLQYDKGFFIPMKSILNIIGWNYEKKNTLQSFFS